MGNSTVANMARMLKLRARTPRATALFLGARAGGLFRSSELYKTLRIFGSDNFDNLTLLERYRQCYDILSDDSLLGEQDIRYILESQLLLQEIKAEIPELYIDGLAKQGHFNPILSTSLYGEFEEAFQQAGMKEMIDFVVKRPKRGSNGGSTYLDKRYLFTLFKVFGDIESGDYNINKRRRQVEEHNDLSKLMTDLRNMDILIVGLDQIWDRGIIHPLFAERSHNSSIWYVNDEEPTRHTELSDFLRYYNAELILGPDGGYETFFKSLFQHMAGAA